ncbi:MAG: glycosyltransferase family 2 protein [Lysobacter sp.]|nr:glycosyltransferase family 2 protein [Lysobacter sp.]
MAGSARIVGLGIVGNEADVIEAFVRHHARLLDELVLVVHRPVDETRAILESLAAEGLPLVLRDARHAAFRQADETSGVARELLRSGADFIVLLDADEFLRLPDPDYLRRALPALPADRFGAWRWQSYVPLPEDDAREPNPLKRIRHRRREEGFDCFKVVLTRAFLREEFFLLEGNHCVMQPGESGAAVPAPMTEYKAVRLAHFPVRSREQLEAKVILGELGKREAHAADPSLGTHWRQLYEMIRDHGPPDAQALRRVAVRYAFPGDAQLDLPADGLVEDPVPADFELRYLPPGSRTALQTVLRWLDARAGAAHRPAEGAA